MNLEDKELVALFEGLDTPGVSDALDKLGLPGQCLGVAPLDNYSKIIVGPAFTVQYVSASVPPATVGDFIEDVAPGDGTRASWQRAGRGYGWFHRRLLGRSADRGG